MTDSASTLPPGEPAHDGHLNAAISEAVVGLMRGSTGRGPTRARTTIRDDVVLVLLEQVLTKAERSLIEAGRADTVVDLRAAIQESMSEELVAVIERLTGRTVRAFMSANHTEPDMAAELFVLEPAG